MFSKRWYHQALTKTKCTQNFSKNCIQCYTSTSQSQEFRRRVVVTGVGVVSPVGSGADIAWNNILNGICGIKRLQDPAYQTVPCKIAAKIDDDELKLSEQFSKSELRSLAPATAYALLAAKEAIESASLKPQNDDECERVGVAVGMGMVDLDSICDTYTALTTIGYNRISPHFIPRILTNMASGHISIKYGFRGPNHSVSTACATGAHAIGDSLRFIRNGDVDVMICGGTEACINPLSISGFCRLRALNTNFNDDPTHASRPFDSDRNGFVMGEGSGILVLEELEHAKRRNANILAEILGYGLSGDASHITSPHPEGRGAFLAMSGALRDAQITPNEISYINAHATSTKIGDEIEANAIRNVFKEHTKNVRVSSTKGHHGHLLGAAGNLETIFTILACRTATLPYTLNLENVPESLKFVNFIRSKPKNWELNGVSRRVALKNAFGFGGTNASLCIAEYSS